MILLLMFVGIILSIIKANEWIVIPTSCIVFCWVVSFLSWMIYSYGKGVGEEIMNKNNKINDENRMEGKKK